MMTARNGRRSARMIAGAWLSVIVVTSFIDGNSTSAQEKNDLASQTKPSAFETRAYRLTTRSELRIQAADQPEQTVKADAVIDHRFRIQPDSSGMGKRVEVIIDQLEVGISGTGTPEGDLITRLDSQALTVIQNGQTRVLKRGDMPEAQQRMLDDFGRVLAVLTLDSNGRERRREVKLKTGVLTENDQLDNVRAMHVPFLADQTSWKAPVRLSMGAGRVAQGELTFTKAPVADAKPGQPVNVEVAGILTAAPESGRIEIKSAQYRVKGAQTYDPMRGIWTDAVWNIEMNVAMVVETRPLTASGSVVVRWELKTGSGD
ncbi:hypothetical protein Isop_1270 [Isosphaera pallida ATCC 43644]|uniref:Uncharacterized protein n=1 Tax=Isosphaera pallida (strain ATCC 43644 / DSM 9630 / IS1B) TaxID=575540 RepID=E8R6F5_ISOPI|nr:hypothetical protein [Isosphaera pallida]ADV61856.1 hypothetical protein Isop_1270 [Isosphaera pallida ATCC 43644]